MQVTGTIKTQKRVRYRNQECHGIASAHKQKFLIRIAENTFNDPVLYGETLLHELVHVWFFILMGSYPVHISERRQHKLIEKLAKAARTYLRREL